MQRPSGALLPWAPGPANVTLHERGAEFGWPVLAQNKVCAEAPFYQDGATASDDECQQRCVNGSTASATASAQLADDGKQVHIRLATAAGGAVALQMDGHPVVGQLRMTTLSAASLGDANSPGNPERISPQTTSVVVGSDGVVTVPKNSFTVFTVPVSP